MAKVQRIKGKVEKDAVKEYDDAIKEANETIEKAKADKTEKMDRLWDSVATRLDRLHELWHGGAAYSSVAEAKQRMLGVAHEADIESCNRIIRQVNLRLDEIQERFDNLEKSGPTGQLAYWLDEFCRVNGAGLNLESMDEVVEELLVLDICQSIWEVLRRIPEFDTTTGAEISKMQDNVIELEEKRQKAISEKVREGKAE